MKTVSLSNLELSILMEEVSIILSMKLSARIKYLITTIGQKAEKLIKPFEEVRKATLEKFCKVENNIYKIEQFIPETIEGIETPTTEVNPLYTEFKKELESIQEEKVDFTFRPLDEVILDGIESEKNFLILYKLIKEVE